MTQSPMRTALADLVDDVAYNVIILAQGVMDMAVLLALGLALYAATVGQPQPVQAQAATLPRQLATSCAMALLADSCITEMVLRPQDS